MILQGGTNIVDNFCSGFSVLTILKMGKHVNHFLLPELRSHFFMNRIVTENRQLAILYSQIYKYTVMTCRFMHFQNSKNFRCTVKCLNKSTTALHIYANFATGLLLSFADRRNDRVFFL